MKASDFKNQPLTVEEMDAPMGITGLYQVIDYLGNVIADNIKDRPTAKAIAALPDTLKRLERLEEVSKKAMAVMERAYAQVEVFHARMGEQSNSGNQLKADLFEVYGNLKTALEDE